MKATSFDLDVTTQGPLYPPSEIMNVNGDFIVIGRIPLPDGSLPWGGAIVSAATVAPIFGRAGVHHVLQRFDINNPGEISALVLHTLPLPLPANNYPMLFAPEQRSQALREERPSFPLHRAPIPDLRMEDGRRDHPPITLGQWIAARGQLCVTVAADGRSALFEFAFEHLVPHAVYTVMSLRERDLDPVKPTRPGPLGAPNVFVTDARGNGIYWARLPNPFPDASLSGANRVVNVVVLYMSSQMCYGGAIGWYGLGGDIHAQLKLKNLDFGDLSTHE
jgi:hypothetical protein